MADLFAGCSDDEDIDKGLRTNNAYAKKYDEWRRKEELMKAKARFGSDLEASSDEDSTDAETEDEDAKQWTSQHEKKFLVTLSALKGRDPKIYNKDEVIFGEVDVKDGEERSRRNAEESKPGNKMTLKDYEREIMSKEGGVYVDDDDGPIPRATLFEETEQDKLAYDEEQKALRESLKAAAWAEENESEENEDSTETLLQKKQRQKEQEVQENEEYIQWLKGETDRLSNKKEAKELAPLRQLWVEGSEDKLDETEKFLRDYILNKRYLTTKEKDFNFEVDFSEDEKDIEEMTEFEHKYNFRFEDPDPEFIKRYPRTIEDSMRRKDTRRADKKAERKARKEQERTQLREEVNRLKSMKKKEILSKIDKLKDIAGSGDIVFEEADIEGDFDPEEHDRRMAALFASYDEQVGEDVYPELPEDMGQELEDLRWDNWDEIEPTKSADSKGNASDSEDSDEQSGQNDSDGDVVEVEGQEDEGDEAEGGERSADEDEQGVSHEDGGIERTESGKLLARGRKSSKLTLEDVLPQKKEKKRKKSKFADVLAKAKPVYDPERDKNFEKYFDEYYKLDFEDVVGGVQTRFKYREVMPNDFGLSTEEILNAQDKELNKWCTLKKMVQFRSADEETKDIEVFSKRKNHMHLKKKILTSVYTTDVEKPDEEIVEAAKQSGLAVDVKTKSTSRKNKKKKKQRLLSGSEVEAEAEAKSLSKDDSLGEKVEEVEQHQDKQPQSGNVNSKKRKRKDTTNDGAGGDPHNEAHLETGQKNPKGKPTKKRPTSGEEQKTNKKAKLDCGSEKQPKSKSSEETIPWEKLTPKQKKNRRNALLKKRKKDLLKEQRSKKAMKQKEKFQPLEDLQMSEARMKAYGLNPNRMKGALVYAKKTPAKKD